MSDLINEINKEIIAELEILGGKKKSSGDYIFPIYKLSDLKDSFQKIKERLKTKFIEEESKKINSEDDSKEIEKSALEKELEELEQKSKQLAENIEVKKEQKLELERQKKEKIEATYTTKSEQILNEIQKEIDDKNLQELEIKKQIDDKEYKLKELKTSIQQFGLEKTKVATNFKFFEKNKNNIEKELDKIIDQINKRQQLIEKEKQRKKVDIISSSASHVECKSEAKTSQKNLSLQILFKIYVRILFYIKYSLEKFIINSKTGKNFDQQIKDARQEYINYIKSQLSETSLDYKYLDVFAKQQKEREVPQNVSSFMHDLLT